MRSCRHVPAVPELAREFVLTLLPNTGKFPNHSAHVTARPSSAKRRWRRPVWVIQPNKDQNRKLSDVNDLLAAFYAGSPNPDSPELCDSSPENCDLSQMSDTAEEQKLPPAK